MLGHTPRIPVWTALAVAALLMGAASAQENADGADAASTADADADRPTFFLKVSPDAVTLKGGGREALKLVVESKTGQSLDLSAVEVPRGLAVKLGHERLAMGAGSARQVVEIGLVAASEMPRGEHPLRIAAVSETGETHEARVLVKVAGPAAGKPAERPHAKPAPERPAERPGPVLRMDPEAQRAKGGERLTFTLVASAPRNGTLELSIPRLPEGYQASLSPETLPLAAGERAKATLTVLLPENATSATLVVHGKLAEGDATVAAKARVEVVRDRPAARDEADERHPLARDARAAAAGGPGFRMQLYPRDALVGPEGGRALVLFEGGPREVGVELKPRLPEDAGWRVVARGHVKVPAHGQAWAWVHLQPGADSGPLHYGLVAVGPQGRAVAEGTAQAGGVRTA